MNVNESDYCEALRKFDQLCDQFEASLRQGIRPEIESYLELISPNVRRRLFQELFVMEMEFAISQGDETDGLAIPCRERWPLPRPA